jgi:hypothetical protein
VDILGDWGLGGRDLRGMIGEWGEVIGLDLSCWSCEELRISHNGTPSLAGWTITSRHIGSLSISLYLQLQMSSIYVNLGLV